MRNRVTWICTFCLALTVALVACKTRPPPLAPAPDFSARRDVTPEFGAADDPDLLRDPGYLEAWKNRRRQQYAALYPDVENAMQLSPAQKEALLDLLVAQQLDHVWLLKLDPANEIDRAALAQHSQELALRHAAELTNLFGADRMPAWNDYLVMQSWRQSALRLRQQIGGPDLLRDDQVEALMLALQQAHAESTRPRSMPANFPPASDMTPEAMRIRRDFAHAQIEKRDALTLAMAKPYLSRRQLGALEAILDSHRFWQKPRDQPSSSSSAGARKL